jgi:hypothetical protein
MMIEPRYLDKERYDQVFGDAPETDVREEKKLHCRFCGGDTSLNGLPDGTVVCDFCMVDLEGETEWEGRDVKC